MATDEPVTTMLSASALCFSGAMRTAMGATIDQNMACVQATPMRDAISMA